MFWHEWEGEDAHALQQMLAEYQDINPGVNVVEFNLPAGSLRDEHGTSLLQQGACYLHSGVFGS